MRFPSRYLMFVVLVLAIGLVTSCSSSGSRAPAPAPEPPAVEPAPTPAPMEEEVVKEPVAESIPSVEVQEELPEDLQELNRRGYLEDVFFETDRYDLQPEAREKLAANSGWLVRYSSVRILVEGHCDERNTREYNLALGERRANTVRDYLVFLGVDPDRVQTISFGEERPFAIGRDESAWQLNRRAHFVIIAR